jgi:hypothetical protein
MLCECSADADAMQLRVVTATGIEAECLGEPERRTRDIPFIAETNAIGECEIHEPIQRGVSLLNGEHRGSGCG